MTNSSGELREDLLERFKETGDPIHLQEWKESVAPVTYSMRLANMILKDNKYLTTRMSSDVPREIKQEMGVNNPDLLSYTYLALMNMIDKWDPKRGSLNHFVYNYVRKTALTLIHEDLNKSSQKNGDISLDVDDKYELIQSQGKVDQWLEEELRLNIEKYAKKKDLYILDEIMGRIGASQASYKMGYSHIQGYYRRKAAYLKLTRDYIKETYNIEGVQDAR